MTQPRSRDGKGRFTQTDPILSRRPTAHYAYAANDPVSKTDPTGLYEEDFHYYAVYYLGLAAGLDQGDAFNVAYASQFMDDSPMSVAPHDYTQINGSKMTRKQTMRFHFVADPNREGVTPETRDVVTEGNKVVQQYVTDAIAAIRPEYVGIEIHALADSFSHAGFVGYGDSKNKRTGSIRPNICQRSSENQPLMVESKPAKATLSIPSRFTPEI